MKRAKKPAVERVDESVHFDAYVARENHKRHVLRWTVLSVAVIMIFLWGFALRNQFTSLTWGKSTEAELVKNASEQWKVANEMSEAKNKAEEITVEQVKEKLAEAIIAANSATSTASTTAMTATSTLDMTTTTTSTTN
jgi:cytoskeletal protein RodZ